MSPEPFQRPIPVPRLDDFADDPAKTAALPAAALAALLRRGKAAVAALEMEIQARLLNALGSGAGHTREDDVLSVDEAARLLGVPPDRLKRQWRRYPFARKASRRAEPVFSQRGLLTWLATRRA